MSKPKQSLFYRFIRRLLTIVSRIWFNYNVIGAENIPDTGGFFICGNHRSYWDVVLLAAGMKNRQMGFLAKKELLKIPVLGFLFKKLNAIPINRGAGDLAALDDAADYVKAGNIINVFPEGTRAKDGILQKPKSGIGLLVHKAKSDVLPYSIYLKNKTFSFRSKITIRFGTLIEYEDFNLEEVLTSKDRKRVAKEVMDNISTLLSKEHTA